MSENSKMDNISLGHMMIMAAIKFDEALAELLKMEIRRLKQLTKENTITEESQKILNLVKSITIALMLTDEKIKTGMDLCKDVYHNKN